MASSFMVSSSFASSTASCDERDCESWAKASAGARSNTNAAERQCAFHCLCQRILRPTPRTRSVMSTPKMAGCDLYHLPGRRSILSEQADANVKVLPRIGADIAHQLPQLGDGVVHVVVQLLVAQQLPGGALALLEAAHHLVETRRHRVEPVVEFLFGDQLARRALAAVDPRGNRVEVRRRGGQRLRSEEHTSELQSLAYLVCR